MRPAAAVPGCGEIVETPGALCAACWPGFTFIAPPIAPAAVSLRAISVRARCAAPARRDRRVPPSAGGAGLRRQEPQAGAAVQARRPDRHRPRLRRLDGARRRRLLAEADLIAPVPLHWRRLFTRRYNQALLLARSPCGGARRGAAGPRPAAPPALDGLADRAGGQGAPRQCSAGFRPPPALGREVAGKSVLLIDDVLTTGATAEACARVLQRGGARHVDVLTLARVVRPAV